MELVSYGHSPLALLAPVTAILLAIATRKILFALGAGIVIGSSLLTQFNLLDTLSYLAQGVINLFWHEGVNQDHVFILLFLVLLGIMTSLIHWSGGTKACGDWAKTRIKTRQGAQLSTVLLGLLIFVDDYFNSLAVGNACRPLTDQHRVSRAKLAYLIDATSAPVCALMPLSSWGAYIIALLGGIMATHGLEHTNGSAIGIFLAMVPMNLYAIFSLALVLATAWWDLNVGAMNSHEVRAQAGELYDQAKGIPPGTVQLAAHEYGQVADLIVPILGLLLATPIMLVWTGGVMLQQQGLPFTVLGALEKTDVGCSLLYGAIVGLLITGTRMLRRKLAGKLWCKAAVEGIRSMLPAIYILLCAWVLADVINHLATGQYLAGLVGDALSPRFMPCLLFVLSGAMAFATGTSWGTFSIMLPIAGDMAVAAEPALLLPMLAAVLAGAVFGDHCSPISDTTILSSTGAACHPIDHVITQMPYALVVAFIAVVGYLVMGITASPTVGFVTALLAFMLTVVAFKKKVGSRHLA